MENPALFILTASFNLLFNLTAMLISRKIARKITRWGWLIFFMQATYLLLSTDFMKNAVLVFRSLFANTSPLSYVIVAFLGASLAMVYWFSIDKAYAKMFSGGGKSTVPETRPTKVADPQLARLEFRTDSAKTLRGFAVHVKLKRGYTIQELGHFRILLQIAHDRKVDFWTGCQDGYASNASLGADKSNQYGIRYTTLYRNKKSHFIPVPAFTGPSKFTGEIGRSTTTDEITFGINLEGQIPSYKTLDNLDGKILDMYATESLAEKINEISIEANDYIVSTVTLEMFKWDDQQPGVKWFLPLTKEEKTVRWRSLGLKDKNGILETIQKTLGRSEGFAWQFDFSSSTPVKLVRKSIFE